MTSMGPPPVPTRGNTESHPRLPDQPSQKRPPSRTVVYILVGVLVVAVLGIPVVLSGVLFPVLIDDFHYMLFNVTASGSNWSLEVRLVRGGTVPTTTYLVVRSPEGVILLNRTSFADLTLANWGTKRALYVDGSPNVAEVSTGDALLLEIATYPTGCSVYVSEPIGTLAAQTLR